MKKLLKGIGLVFIGLLVIGVLFGEAEPTEPENITYQSISIKTMYNDLNENAMRAKEKYDNQYAELTGYVNVIDSDGSYFNITATNEWYEITGIICYFTTDEQREYFINNINLNDKITIKCKITDVGEVLGYYCDVKEIVI